MCLRPPAERRDLHFVSAPVAHQLEQRAVHPVDDGTVVFARTVEPGVVGARLGDEEIMAEQSPVRVQQRQGLSEAGKRAIAYVHPDVAATLEQGAENLAG